MKKLECILLCLFNSIFDFLLLVGCALGTALVSLVVVLYSNLSDSNEGCAVRTEYTTVFNSQFWFLIECSDSNELLYPWS